MVCVFLSFNIFWYVTLPGSMLHIIFIFFSLVCSLSLFFLIRRLFLKNRGLISFAVFYVYLSVIIKAACHARLCCDKE